MKRVAGKELKPGDRYILWDWNDPPNKSSLIFECIQPSSAGKQGTSKVIYAGLKRPNYVGRKMTFSAGSNRNLLTGSEVAMIIAAKEGDTA